MTTQKIKFVLIFFGIAILTAAGFGVLHVLAAPSSACTPNTPGCGAISTDASFNVSIGTSTPGGLARLLLVGSSTSANDKAFNIVNSAGTQILKAYNDGGVSFGTASDPGAGGISFSGNFSGLINASNISAGTFSSGAYTFASPSTLTVNGTTTASGYCIGSSCIAVWPSGGSGSGWTTSGTYVILATSTNNVGIGTATPDAKLQANTSALYAGDTVGQVPVIEAVGNGQSQTTQTMFRLYRPTVPGLYYGASADFNLYAYTTGTPPKTQLDIALKSVSSQVETADVTVMSLRDNGNVGIGTASPGAKLHLSLGTNAISETLRLENTNNVGSNGNEITWVNAGYTNAGAMIQGYRDGSGVDYILQLGASSNFTTTNAPAAITILGNNGNVGIGTAAPTYKLDVASAGATTARFGTAAADTVVIGGGSGKITVGTVDPVYTINGNKFATYGAEMTGVKGETTGDVNFAGTDFAAGQTYSYTLDLAGSAQGSDLWLFKETTQIVKDNLNGLVVILTPGFDGNAWYVKNPAAGTVTIFAKPATGSTALEASYRLTAPRFDASHWSNVGATDAPAGIIIND